MAKRISLIVAALVCAPAAMAQQPGAPSMSTSWRSITYDQPTCIARAQGAMQAAGLTQNYETVGESVYGEVPSYTGAIRCVSTKGIAYFVVAGPDVKMASKYQGDLVRMFEQGAQAAPPQGGGQGGQGGQRSGEKGSN